MIFTIPFWRGAGERAVKTFFQTLVALLAANATDIGAEVGIGMVPWQAMLSIAGLAALTSLFTSISNARFTAGLPVEATGEGEPANSPVGFRHLAN